MLELFAPFLCLAVFLIVMGGVVAISAKSQKNRKGYYFYNDDVFATFWDQYASEPAVALRDVAATSRGGTWVSYKYAMMQLHVYINKIGVFYYSAVQANQTYGALLLFNKNDIEKYNPRGKMPLSDYEIEDENTLILHCESPTPFGRGTGRLVLKGIDPNEMEKIQYILEHHFRPYNEKKPRP